MLIHESKYKDGQLFTEEFESFRDNQISIILKLPNEVYLCGDTSFEEFTRFVL